MMKWKFRATTHSKSVKTVATSSTTWPLTCAQSLARHAYPSKSKQFVSRIINSTSLSSQRSKIVQLEDHHPPTHKNRSKMLTKRLRAASLATFLASKTSTDAPTANIIRRSHYSNCKSKKNQRISHLNLMKNEIILKKTNQFMKAQVCWHSNHRGLPQRWLNGWVRQCRFIAKIVQDQTSLNSAY